MFSAKKEEQTGDRRSPERGCQWVPLPGEVRESLTKERKLSQGLALVRWTSLPI